jgi:hypothetical protein
VLLETPYGGVHQSTAVRTFAQGVVKRVKSRQRVLSKQAAHTATSNAERPEPEAVS